MADSPFVKTIHPPIADLSEYVECVRQYRVECDRGENNKHAQTELTEIAEDLLEHCEFLTEKLKVKEQLRAENTHLKTSVDALQRPKNAQKGGDDKVCNATDDQSEEATRVE